MIMINYVAYHNYLITSLVSSIVGIVVPCTLLSTFFFVNEY